MKIVIVGGGKVGSAIARELSDEGHDITIIDSDKDNVEQLSLRIDCMVLQGNGMTLSMLRQAGAEECDLLIAATPVDEVNMLTCFLARKLGCANTIARLRNVEYREEIEMLRDDLGLSMVVTPDGSAAREAHRLMQYPGFLKREKFARSQVELVAFELQSDSELAGKRMMDLPKLLRQKVLVCAVRRGDEAIIPDGAFCMQSGDEIYVTASTSQLGALMENLGLRRRRLRNVMIIGGGRMGFELARELTRSKVRVKLLDKDPERCRMIADLLPDVQVICADGTRQEKLMSENVTQMDAVAALTNSDEENMFICMYAKMVGVPMAVPKINRGEYTAVCQNCGIRAMVSPKSICAQEITRYARAMMSKNGEGVLSVSSFMDGKVEALEFAVTSDTPHLGERLADVKLRANILVAGITRGGRPILPGGGDSLQIGDSVIVVTAHNGVIVALRDIFAD